jgi:hypothetical protein
MILMNEQTAITTISVRCIASATPPRQLKDISMPMEHLLSSLSAQLAELKAYKAQYGELKGPHP